MISVSFKQTSTLLKKAKGAQLEINLFMAAQMQHNRGMLFARSGNYNGHEQWARPLLRDGQPLKDRGTLSQSMGPRSGANAQQPVRTQGSVVKFHGNVVSIGTTLIYAALMNWGTTKMPGGVMKPKNKPVFWIPIPGGKKASETAKSLTKSGGSNIVKYMGKTFLLAKQVRIPARRFDNLTEQDKHELDMMLGKKLSQVLNR